MPSDLNDRKLQNQLDIIPNLRVPENSCHKHYRYCLKVQLVYDLPSLPHSDILYIFHYYAGHVFNGSYSQITASYARIPAVTVCVSCDNVIDQKKEKKDRPPVSGIVVIGKLWATHHLFNRQNAAENNNHIDTVISFYGYFLQDRAAARSTR